MVTNMNMKRFLLCWVHRNLEKTPKKECLQEDDFASLQKTVKMLKRDFEENDEKVVNLIFVHLFRKILINFKIKHKVKYLLIRRLC
ncbi:hypothetical protein Anas_07279 [Armadillidium nasatum]|uniref:Uncharacterized protein n=1 Tax=Armadillidium nasatum TaxID=96803 RepID=A0A5N5SPD9_9CRUS|nr:hypothetical protein Anas_07279 [Armadillidium nasatum]